MSLPNVKVVIPELKTRFRRTMSKGDKDAKAPNLKLTTPMKWGPLTKRKELSPVGKASRTRGPSMPTTPVAEIVRESCERASMILASECRVGVIKGDVHRPTSSYRVSVPPAGPELSPRKSVKRVGVLNEKSHGNHVANISAIGQPSASAKFCISEENIDPNITPDHAVSKLHLTREVIKQSPSRCQAIGKATENQSRPRVSLHNSFCAVSTVNEKQSVKWKESSLGRQGSHAGERSMPTTSFAEIARAPSSWRASSLSASDPRVKLNSEVSNLPTSSYGVQGSAAGIEPSSCKSFKSVGVLCERSQCGDAASLPDKLSPTANLLNALGENLRSDIIAPSYIANSKVLLSRKYVEQSPTPHRSSGKVRENSSNSARLDTKEEPTQMQAAPVTELLSSPPRKRSRPRFKGLVPDFLVTDKVKTRSAEAAFCFQSGLGTNIPLSTVYINLVSSVKDVPSTEIPTDGKELNSGEFGFQNGSGRSVQLRNANLEYAASILGIEGDTSTQPSQEDSAPVTLVNRAASEMGFKTGLGKRVLLSDESLQVAQSLMAQERNPVAGISPGTIGRAANEHLDCSFTGLPSIDATGTELVFQTGAGRHLPLSSVSLNIAHARLGSSGNFRTGSAFGLSERKNNGVGKSGDRITPEANQGSKASSSYQAAKGICAARANASMLPSSAAMDRAKLLLAEKENCSIAGSSYPSTKGSCLARLSASALPSSAAMDRAKLLLAGKESAIFDEEKVWKFQEQPLFHSSGNVEEASISKFIDTKSATNSLRKAYTLHSLPLLKEVDEAACLPLDSAALLAAMHGESSESHRTNAEIEASRKLGLRSALRMAETGHSSNPIIRKGGPYKAPRKVESSDELGPSECSEAQARTDSNLGAITAATCSNLLGRPAQVSLNGPETYYSKLLLGSRSEMMMNESSPDRKSIREYFLEGSCSTFPVCRLPLEDQLMSSGGYNLLTFVDFRAALLGAGASPDIVTRDWVHNHFKMIVWKLASYERIFPLKAAGKLLTAVNVLDQLKYRHDRELCGHRSAIRRITERDAPASELMTLFVSAVYLKEHLGDAVNQIEVNDSKLPVKKTADIEVTDGWYALKAFLDAPSIKLLQAGKLCAGKKIQVCGASLVGCADGLPPLEAFNGAALVINRNGLYRSRWYRRLGFCREPMFSLALHCIQPGGGLIPKSLFVVSRIYPIMYKEKVDGSWITRSARAESIAVQRYEEKRAKVIEEIMSRLEASHHHNARIQDGMDEGARLYVSLESAAEPDLLLADMTPAQHKALSEYQRKRETSQHSDIERHVRKGLEDADLVSRDVSAVLKLRVKGLTCNRSRRLKDDKVPSDVEAIVSLWQHSDDMSIVEGAVYSVSSLLPSAERLRKGYNENLLYLNTTRSSTWCEVPPAEYQKDYVFHFVPRSRTRICELCNDLLGNEFDIAALVLQIGEPIEFGCFDQMKQWVFVADGSYLKSSVDSCPSSKILAIDVLSSRDAFVPINRSIVGHVVAHCNIRLYSYDATNNLWVAHVSEFYDISTKLDSRSYKHLQLAAGDVRMWAASVANANLIEALRRKASAIMKC